MPLSMNRWINKTAVVTGAGGGIGAAIVKQLLEEKLQVAAIDICPKSLENLQKDCENNKQNLHVFQLDITEETQVINFYSKLTKDIGLPHILVNCAGIHRMEKLMDGNVETWRKMFDVNVISICIMSKQAIKIMKNNNIDGHIINICSVAGHQIINLPCVNVYSASKFAVRALCETYRQEFNRYNLKIKITNISPGKVNTSLFKNSNSSNLEEIMAKLVGLESNDVADAIIYVLSTPPHVQVHELIIKPIGEKE